MVAANVSLPRADGVRYEDVETAAELEEAARRLFPDADVLVMAAAVADFRPPAGGGRKLSKAGRDALDLRLEPTTDVLARPRPRCAARARRSSGSPPSTAEGRERARGKLERKGLDAVVVNDIAGKEIGFDAGENEVTDRHRAATAPSPRRRRPRSPARSWISWKRCDMSETSSAEASTTSSSAAARCSSRATSRPPRCRWRRRAVRARQDVDPRGSRPCLLPLGPLRRRPARSSARSSSARRSTTSPTSASADRSRRPAARLRPAATWRSRANLRPDRADYRVYRDRLRRRLSLTRSRSEARGSEGAHAGYEQGRDARSGRRASGSAPGGGAKTRPRAAGERFGRSRLRATRGSPVLHDAEDGAWRC